MDRAHLRHILSRIARGLPLVTGPLVLVSGLSGCDSRCSGPFYSFRTTMHPSSPVIVESVGTPDAFRAELCPALCRALDEVTTADAGVGADESWSDYGEAATFCYYVGEDLRCDYGAIGPCIGGRAPAGLVAPRTAASACGAIAHYFAHSEHLERASVGAFEELGTELSHQGAPPAFIRAARRSAMDERSHALALGRLRARWGASALPVERRPTYERDLAAIALDNAIEGCGRETYGALVAALQAETAADLTVRATYAQIATDEARHALLSFALNDWMLPRLSPRARRDVEARRQNALSQFAASVGDEPSPALRFLVGLPDATQSRDLVALVG